MSTPLRNIGRRSERHERETMGLRAITIAAALLPLAAGCDDQRTFARVFKITEMSQTIGGPAAVGRPDDLLLENDRIRAIVHGRRNTRSTLPISNGSLVDVDLQRPHHRFGAGHGADAFYELGAMANLKVNDAKRITHGPSDEIGVLPAPKPGCVRVSVAGAGEDFMGVLGLLDLVMKREYVSDKLELITDYDLCPGEALVRVGTTVRLDGEGAPLELDPLTGSTSLLTALLGESDDTDCAKQPCPAGTECDDLLVKLSLGTLNTEMKRCRKPSDKLAGVLTGDLMLMSANVSVFIPGSGFDHETFIRSVFDTGGDIFSNPLSLDWVAAVGDDVSYVYFEQKGKVMIPVFAESFTVSMTNWYGCPKSDPSCLEGKELRFRRLVGVGGGDVASALASYYAERKIPTGRLEGKVIDPRSQQPVSGTDVFALALPQSWQQLSDREIGQRSYAQLVAANRAQTKSEAVPLGVVGMVSHFRTDVGLDTVKDGSFGGPLPAGRYALVTRDAERPASRLVPVTITVGATAETALFAGEAGTLEYEIRDAAGRPLPSKLTIGHCFKECARDEDCQGNAGGAYCYQGSKSECETAADCTEEGETCTARGVCLAYGPRVGLCVPNRDGSYADATQCRPDQVWDGETCSCPTTGRLPLELGGSRMADGTDKTVLSGHGHGTLHLPPGTYQVIVSRGLEYETERRLIKITPGTVARLSATLPRVVDTKGWISADFHVHGPGSVDSGLDHRSRVRSYVAEGVELLSSSDHDQITDYGPTIDALELRRWIKAQSGVEISSLDYGHFLGFPLLFDENVDLNGSFHWRGDKSTDSSEPDPDPNKDWRNLPPKEIFAGLRERGLFGADETVVAIAHYYDHFTFYDVDPWTLDVPLFNVQAVTNSVLAARNFSGDFDAVEAFNGKGIDLIRRPTAAEARDYNVRMAEVLSDPSLDPPARQAAWHRVSADAQRSFLIRTEEEQPLALRYDNARFVCRCVTDTDCGEGFLCDGMLGSCIRGCADDSGCAAELVAAGREACEPLGGRADNATRRTCQRTPGSCTRNADCMRQGQLFGDEPEVCQPLDESKPEGPRGCQLACTRASDCAGDALRPVCVEGRCQAEPHQPAGANEPCRQLRGTVDDWFQMLNRGVRRSLLGNSDSHSTYGGEAGLPRNYVRSSSDLAGGIDRREIARNVKAQRSFASYGPFVELTVNDQPLGSEVKIDAGSAVKLRLRIQSPRWFDVDRIELYRNGELIKIVEGKVGCAHADPACIRVPNDRVVNYDQTIEDKPDQDAWYVAVVAGVDGKTLAPVYSSTPVARLGMFELIQRLTPLLPPLRGLRTPFSPSITEVRPYAVTNPIWVDVGGDGYEPPDALPAWATKADQQRISKGEKSLGQPPAGSAGAHSHSHDGTDHAHHADLPAHDHRQGIARMRHDARAMKQQLREGKLGPDALLKAIRGLRYIR